MAVDRRAERTAPVRQRAAPAAVQRGAAPAAAAPARALQTRLGNQATQALVAHAIAPAIQASRLARLPAKVSTPTDPAELEAEEIARKVVRMREPAAKPTTTQSVAKGTVQRAAAPPATPSPASAGIASGPGSPLPAPVRARMEPSFGAHFGGVRVHTSDAAARQSTALKANAFTFGQHIFFGKGKFQPETAAGQELLAHELTHTIQQGAARQGAIQRSEAVDVSYGVEPHVQRSIFDIPSPRKYFANKAANIPGFTMLTVVIGFNPITNERVERNAGHLLRAAIQLIPGGALITQALDNHGVFDRVSQWVAAQFETIKNIGATLYQDIENFIDQFSITDLADPGGLWERGKAIVMRPIDRIIAFAISVKDGIVQVVKDAILKPIAAFARTTRGYPLLCTILGRDPITGEPVPQDLDALLGGFLKFIGEDELWETMKKAQAVPRAFAWFNSALNALRGFIAELPGLFVAAFRSLELVDILIIPRAFFKVASVFGNFALRFVTWGAGAVWTLLEIIFDVVSPGALAYVKKTGAALRSILRNPLPFVGNLVKAAKLGFTNFAANFVGHLKAGLINWLTGSLPGVYIPKAFSLVEIAQFVFSVLGLTWANIRAKLVKATSETVVKTLETGFDIVVTLVRDGPAAAWDKIKEQLANLKDMVIGGITDFVVDMVVKKAVPKLIAMFIPGAGFISAILSIYDTIMVFVNRIKQIISVVKSFVDSIVAIAQGAVGAAAAAVENALATGLSLAINFAAGFVGLGNVAEKVMGVINKIRAPIDKALDWLVGWIVGMAKKLGKMVAQAGLPADPKQRLKLALDAAFAATRRFGKGVSKILLTPILAGIKIRYGLQSIEAFERGGTWWVKAVANPEEIRNLAIIVVREVEGVEETPKASVLPPMSVVAITFDCNTDKYVQSVYDEQLKGQEAGLNAISVVDWEKNRKKYDESGRGSNVPQEETRELYRKDLQKRTPKLTDAEIEAQLERLAALHEPDLVAGGFNVIGKLGSRYINSSIGSQWRTRVKLLADAVDALKGDKPKYRIHVKLQSKKIDPPS